MSPCSPAGHRGLVPERGFWSTGAHRERHHRPPPGYGRREVIAEAELRIGETKRQAVVYTRNGRNYVRPKAEFHDKFSLAVSTESK